MILSISSQLTDFASSLDRDSKMWRLGKVWLSLQFRWITENILALRHMYSLQCFIHFLLDSVHKFLTMHMSFIVVLVEFSLHRPISGNSKSDKCLFPYISFLQLEYIHRYIHVNTKLLLYTLSLFYSYFPFPLFHHYCMRFRFPWFLTTIIRGFIPQIIIHR